MKVITALLKRCNKNFEQLWTVHVRISSWCNYKPRPSSCIRLWYFSLSLSFDYDSPYIVSIGHGRIIAGMDRGLMNMCLWERRRITIPPHLGYGQRGVGQLIPPNSTLVFYVRLIKIERVSSWARENWSVVGGRLVAKVLDCGSKGPTSTCTFSQKFCQKFCRTKISVTELRM